MNILIVEDDPDICYLYSIWLQEYNCNYVIAKNVEDGLYEYHKSLKNDPNNLNHFDLIILDYDLKTKNGSFPAKNGLNVAKEVLKINKDQRIIFASAWPQRIFNEYIETLKCFIEILQKPFEKDIFINMVYNTIVFDTLKKVVENMRTDYSNPLNPDTKNYTNLFRLLWKLQKDSFGEGSIKSSNSSNDSYRQPFDKV
jgi:CheY-like chemotaxis protein